MEGACRLSRKEGKIDVEQVHKRVMPDCTGLKRREVVTAFLRHGKSILLVRRSGRVGSYQGLWSGISGFLEEPTPLQQALREIREETGLEQGVRLVSAAAPIEVPDPTLDTCWVVYPFLFDVDAPEQIRLDWENTELRWAAPEEIPELPTVPALAEAFARVSSGQK